MIATKLAPLRQFALSGLLFCGGLAAGAGASLYVQPSKSVLAAPPDAANLAERMDVILARQTEIELRHESLIMLGREADLGPAAPTKPDLKRQSASHGETLPELSLVDWATAAVERGLDEIEAVQLIQIERMAATLRADRKRLARHWAALGLDPYKRATSLQPGVGGPYIPPPPGDHESAFGLAFQAARHDFMQAAAFRKFADHVPLGVPLASEAEIMSGFGIRRDPFTRGMAMHSGVDLREEPGAPARATAAGRVVEADWSGGYGRMVEIDHGGGMMTRYAHLSRIAVKPGEWVARGQIIGRVGSTGRSTGPHLHYETHVDGKPVNPLRFMRAAAPINRYR